jgi:SAM-dependent methyltransferase
VTSGPKRYKAIALYYDAEYADLPMLREDVPFFLGQLPAKKQSILELCVGTARAAIPMAAFGHRVAGVDYDDDLLAIARQKRDAAGVSDKRLELICADAKAVELCKKFDWVCVFFNTLLAFPTLDELDQLLATVRRHLKPRGRLWVDIFNPDLTLLSNRKSTGLEPRTFFVPELNRSVFCTTDVEVDQAAQVQQVTFNYRWFDPAGRTHRERFRFELTWLFPRELQLLMERSGFDVEAMYGNYDASPVTSVSPRIITRCVMNS